MRITYDDQFLVTVSEDGCIVLWRIQDTDGRGKKSDKDVFFCSYTKEVLITRTDLEEKVRSRCTNCTQSALHSSSSFILFQTTVVHRQG